MPLPPRVKPFLERLEEFLDRSDLAAFSNEAAKRFVGPDRLPLPEEELAFRSYAMYTHKGADGRGLIDRFLETEGAKLDPEEREAFRRMREAVFGCFRVDETRPGKGLRVTGLATSESYEIVEVQASRTLAPGDGFFGWIVPYRDRYELAFVLFHFPPEFTYLAERLARSDPEAFREEILDPVRTYRIMKSCSQAPRPPGNRVEAEIFAAHVFGKVGFPLSVEEVQRRFQTLKGPFELMREVKLPPLKSEGDLRLLTDAIAALWNFTPREDLGGRSPTEVHRERLSLGLPEMPQHLLQDFLATVLRELGPELEKHPEKARKAMRKRFERWLEEPQEELGGRSPREFVEGAPRRFAPPDPESLPPPGRPVWTAEALEEKTAELLRTDKLHGLVAILPEMVRHGFPVPEEALRRLLDADDDWIADCLFTEAADQMSRTQGAAFARLVAERLPRLRERNCAGSAYEVLGRFAPAEHVDELRDALRDRSLSHAWRWCLLGLLQVSEELAADEALAILEDADLWDASMAVSVLFRAGSPDAVREGARRFLKAVARHEGPYDLVSALFRGFPDAGLGSPLYNKVQRALFPDSRTHFEDKGVPAPSLLSVFSPQADPSAARRFLAVFPPERWQRLERHAQKKEYRRLSVLLAEAAREALAAASEENPAFAPLAARLGVFADEVVAQSRHAGGSTFAQEVISIVLGTIVAKAIRGHDAAREIQAAGSDPATYRALLRVDEDWIKSEVFQEVLRHADPRELQKLARSSDPEVRLNAVALLAAGDPEAHLAKIWDSSPCPTAPGWARLDYACVAAGERAIEVALREVFQRGRPCSLGTVLCWLADAGTERARAYLAHYLEAFFEPGDRSVSTVFFLERSFPLLDRDIARRLVDAYRAGRIEPASEPGETRRSLVGAFRTLKELTGIPEDPETTVDEGFRAYLAKHPDVAEELGLYDEDDFPEEGGDAEGPNPKWPAGGSAPFERRWTNVGRNDPCPCGSGKKYKNCCGRKK